MEETKKLWERTFDEPYEKAGGTFLGTTVSSKPSPVYWEVTDTDVNTRYKSMVPRFLLEVCVFARLNTNTKEVQGHTMREFLRFRVVRCHRKLKIDKPMSSFPLHGWQKACHLYCEFATRGIALELRHRKGLLFKGSSLEGSMVFLWNDLLRDSSLSLRGEVDQKVKVVASITPPVQASYLLKCVPDRVTDDSGAMISDVILRMNQYRPQEGRWLSRTVLDHAGRECFVVRMRVGEGFWRRGGDTPRAVKWEDRIIEIREGSWSYVADSIGRVPVTAKVVGTATPIETSDQGKASWRFSTGDELMISTSASCTSFLLKNDASPDSSAKLLRGRNMQYRVEQTELGSANEERQAHEEEEGTGDEEDTEEEGFLTLVRYTEENPGGKATALLNWKHLAVELSPEEDAVFALLLCVSILRSTSETRKEDAGRLLIRRRLKEAKHGARDWGSVVLHPSSRSSPVSSHLQPWHWDASTVVASDREDHISRQPTFTYSPAEGGDRFYKRGLIS